MHKITTSFLSLFPLMLSFSPVSAASLPSSTPVLDCSESISLSQASNSSLIAQGGCSQRVGPFATQSTAWQRWRQARSLGYAVSNGVYPCYGYGTRGYCFNVFYPC